MLSITRRISEYNHYNENSIDYLVVHDTGNYKDSAAANANYFNGGNRGSSAHYFVDDISIYQVVEDYNGAWHVGDGHGKYGITNTNSIGIEMCNSGGYISEKTINNTLELVKYLMSKYNIPIDRVVRHYDASRKICPNNMAANNWAKWNEFKNRIRGKRTNEGQQAPQQRITNNTKDRGKTELIRRLQQEINNQGFGEISVDGIAGVNTLSSSPTCKRGARGNITKIIQEMLINMGYINFLKPWGADGVFGQGTEDAIRHFQKNYGLSSDGIIGRNTWKKFFEKLN